MKIWNVLEKLNALDLNTAFSEAVVSKATITRNADGSVASIVDTARTPNITYTLTYEFDEVKTISNGTTTWTINRDSDGNLTNITQTP